MTSSLVKTLRAGTRSGYVRARYYWYDDGIRRGSAPLTTQNISKTYGDLPLTQSEVPLERLSLTLRINTIQSHSTLPASDPVSVMLRVTVTSCLLMSLNMLARRTVLLQQLTDVLSSATDVVTNLSNPCGRNPSSSLLWYELVVWISHLSIFQNYEKCGMYCGKPTV